MANVTEGEFKVVKKYVDDANNVLMFDWMLEYNVENAITPLETGGVELVPAESGLTVNSTAQEYRDYLTSTKVASFYDDLKSFMEHQSDFHLIRETTTEIV